MNTENERFFLASVAEQDLKATCEVVANQNNIKTDQDGFFCGLDTYDDPYDLDECLHNIKSYSDFIRNTHIQK